MNDRVRQQQRSMMLYNLVAFSLIFTLFGFILYSQIRSSLYRPVNQALTAAREGIERDLTAWVNRQLSFVDAFPRGGEDFEGPKTRCAKQDSPPAEGGGQHPPFEAGKGVTPMRIQSILRDASGEIRNAQVQGWLYFEGYLDQIPPTRSGEITSFQLGDAPCFSLAFEGVTDDGAPYTIQLITQVEAERAILNNFVRLLVLCVVVFVLLSLLASYLLSKKTMAPILRSWDRQTEFVENASHELRTPLTIIQNKLESLLTQPQATVMERAQEIGVSLSETRHLSKLTADLMTLARADSGETLLEKERFPLDVMIAGVCEPYAELAALQGKRMTLSLGYDREIHADQNRIHELMVILLDNALKYTREGDAITVRTARADGRLLLEVADTGIGISEEHVQRVFDRFYRADKARSREKGGSGLGLSIAKWIVDAHGGIISAQPAQDGGAVIQVKLKE